MYLTGAHQFTVLLIACAPVQCHVIGSDGSKPCWSILVLQNDMAMLENVNGVRDTGCGHMITLMSTDKLECIL